MILEEADHMKKALAFTLAILLAVLLTLVLSVGAAQAGADAVSGATPQVPDDALIQQIDAFFAMTRDEIIAMLGPDFEVEPAGPEGVCDGYFYEDLGLTFAFYPDEDALELIVGDANFRIGGVGVGSLFSEIMEALGDTEIIETWMELPIYTVFVLEYHWGDSTYSFISFDVDEPVHLLWIFQRP